jgi:hypothetical protein
MVGCTDPVTGGVSSSLPFNEQEEETIERYETARSTCLNCQSTCVWTFILGEVAGDIRDRLRDRLIAQMARDVVGTFLIRGLGVLGAAQTGYALGEAITCTTDCYQNFQQH